jgi:hypothetical protein
MSGSCGTSANWTQDSHAITTFCATAGCRRTAGARFTCFTSTKVRILAQAITTFCATAGCRRTAGARFTCITRTKVRILTHAPPPRWAVSALWTWRHLPLRVQQQAVAYVCVCVVYLLAPVDVLSERMLGTHICICKKTKPVIILKCIL